MCNSWSSFHSAGVYGPGPGWISRLFFVPSERLIQLSFPPYSPYNLDYSGFCKSKWLLPTTRGRSEPSLIINYHDTLSFASKHRSLPSSAERWPLTPPFSSEKV